MLSGEQVDYILSKLNKDSDFAEFLIDLTKSVFGEEKFNSFSVPEKNKGILKAVDDFIWIITIVNDICESKKGGNDFKLVKSCNCMEDLP